eukprot:CAMPEP_0204271426 /NCGR_PEP_ID=MMETSP0468-20130131/19846_1 /ASSEMBLY_ACC=CAM_ASM_000383 /TAXON_ID=2969 /ORGANISM="Oxyrrhis marina" /LENGTH=469 /DNA_ID=CAMNT_0051247095 /DNA_START=131 /DNA_END=1540 /DNA_ORIENTATION=-
MMLKLAVCAPVVVAGLAREAFTTNAACLKNNCINPVFPGLEQMTVNQNKEWTCADRSNASATMDFCKGLIDYDFALPAGDTVAGIRTQETAALTQYFFHISAMGIDAWGARSVQGECYQSIQKMTCWSMFPKCAEGKKAGEKTAYVKPCMSSCQNYVRACNVECCDESVQCVFEHKKLINSTNGTVVTVTTTGYDANEGPSPTCTGAAGGLRGVAAILMGLLGVAATSAMSNRKLAVLALLAVSLTMQGCTSNELDGVSTHQVGNWRAEKDYLLESATAVPEREQPVLNSCTVMGNPSISTCNARGSCKAWNQDNLDNPVFFCFCDRDWAGAECRTQRKSQSIAYTLSIFLGYVGADQFYLGFYIRALLKLCTLGGGGVWWLADIVRIGASPIPAKDYDVAADLPHWLFVITSVLFALTISFIVVALATAKSIKGRRASKMMLSRIEQEEAQLEYPASKQISYGAISGV